MIEYTELAINQYKKYQGKEYELEEDEVFAVGGLAFCLEQVGEQLAKNNLSENILNQFQFDWYEIRDFRNFVAHEYHAVVKEEIFENI